MLYLLAYMLNIDGTSVVKIVQKLGGVTWDVLAPLGALGGRTIHTKVMA